MKKYTSTTLVPSLAVTTAVATTAMATFAVVALAAPAVAHAEEKVDSRGYIELVAGAMLPLGEEEYSDFVDSSFKLGVRGGVWARKGGGFEMALDWTPVDNDLQGGQFVDIEINRFRLQVGGRGGAMVAPHVKIFGRLLFGVDYIRASGDVLGFDYEETDVGLAVEVGGGVLVNVADALAVGVQFAVPMAFHFEEDDPDDDTDSDLEYNAYDLDILFTVATPF